MPNFKKIAFVAACSSLAFAATAASASGPVTVVTPEVVHAPIIEPVRDWAGAYGGLSFSRVGGAITENPGGGVFPDLENDSAFGLFLGYNWQRGSFVFGGELSYTRFDTAYVGFPVSFQQNALELRARAGLAIDNFLVYGFIGAARSDLDDAGTVIDQSGVSYGLGGQYMFRNGMFAGLELARRDVSGTVLGNPISSDIDTVSLRVGFQF